jgi:adenine-specific DNA-methyltransferase
MAKPGAKPVERQSVDLVGENIARLKELFPEAVSEGKVDFEKLKATLGEIVDDRPERYSFTWAGKRDAIRLLQVPSRATLKPCPEQSVNWDTTKNLFIEGENLEVLKLLYKSYAGRVKMIYIDPPYNTGNDFIYPDDFADPLENYLTITGQKDAEGNLLTSNPETSGRYHSAWLSMMYPRLFVARQLLGEDGAIFVSIDDHEVSDLRLLMNELFGEENFLAVFVRRRRMATGMRGDPISPDHEYVVAFAKSRPEVTLYGATKKDLEYPYQDKKSRYRSTDLTVGMTKKMRPKQFYEITNPRTGKTYLPPDDRVWRFQPVTMQEQIDQDNIIWPDDFPERRMRRPRFKTRQPSDESDQPTKPVSTWIESNGNSEDSSDRLSLSAGMNQEGTKELKELFGAQIAEYPKPVSLVRSLIELATASDDIVVDFFAGTATTAHAVLEVNHELGSSRRFIMVQLPEPTPADSTAYAESYPTIAEVSKERIRRAIKGFAKEGEDKLDLAPTNAPDDYGFRVFKLDESRYRHWRGVTDRNAQRYTDEMELFTDPLLPGWQPEDVIWEVALKEGYSLSSTVETLPAVKRNHVFRVIDADREQSFCICLDDRLHNKTPESLALGQEDLFVCRDAALTDEQAANLALQCKLKTI